jgi:hypothetical protein
MAWLLLAKHCPGDGVTEREVVGEREQFEWANGRGRVHLKDDSVVRRMILR